ncbi:MAG: hypothetical protein KDD15_26935, partial [Lewinella sp.]|nr:hypothetical protein [Lewinella sp.]
MGQHFFLLFLSLHAGFISTIQANELEAGIIYSNQQGMTLKLHQNKEFEYLLGNFQHSILISGKYDIIAMGANDQIICRIEARSLLSDQKNRDGYDYLWGSDSLKFGFIHENAISPIGGEGQLNVSPILYKIRDRSATYVERTSYANRKEGIVFIETETDTSSFLSCYSFDEKEGRNGELLWKLKLPLFGEKKENDGVSYAYYSQLAEYAVLGGDLLQAAVYYDSSFAFLAHPLASDLYNAALLSLALGDQLKSEEYLKALQLKGISLDRISKKSNLIRDFLSHSRSDVGSSFNTEIQRIEQYSSHTKNEYFRMFFRDLEANDQFYRKKKKLKEYRDKLSQIDSLNQAQLIRFYELYGFPREQELQDYHKDKEPVFSSFPGLIVNVHNTYYGD